ncbi:class I SAM-dependent methyltransferase [Streptomyces cinerochromogenes]|uniref:class I SAM-dependent methyltransferase n=1 Tax=Streptomyces cinerochromogenes TaxID=66422 RepID=UPI0033BE98B4
MTSASLKAPGDGTGTGTGTGPGNVVFYQQHGASAIMRAAHFPDGLLAFLQMESLAVHQAASRYGCATLVELGCYDGRSLEVARAAGVDYLGIDVNTAAVERVRRRIADEGLHERARAVVGDAMRCADWLGELDGGRPLLLLPFNLLGNFPSPEALLRGLRQAGGIAVLSVFHAFDAATDLRRDYYTACGISPLEEHPGPYGGVVFRSGDAFQSQSFTRQALADLCAECGITVLGEAMNSIGLCLTVCLD